LSGPDDPVPEPGLEARMRACGPQRYLTISPSSRSSPRWAAASACRSPPRDRADSGYPASAMPPNFAF